MPPTTDRAATVPSHLGVRCRNAPAPAPLPLLPLLLPLLPLLPLLLLLPPTPLGGGENQAAVSALGETVQARILSNPW